MRKGERQREKGGGELIAKGAPHITTQIHTTTPMDGLGFVLTSSSLVE